MKTFLKIFLIFSLVNILLIFSLSNINAQWITERIDTLTHDEKFNTIESSKSIAIDDVNTIYAVWTKREYTIPHEVVSSVIFFSNKSVNEDWIDPVPISDTLKLSNSPSIVISKKTHKIYIVYIEFDTSFINGEIILAMRDESNIWSRTNLNNNLLSDSYPTLDIDANDHIHIVYSEYSSGRSIIKYCSNVSGSWITSTLNDDYNGYNYAYPTLSVTSEGIAHIIYYSSLPVGERNIHAENLIAGGAKWKFELLPEQINRPGILKTDNNGVLHFIYNYAKGFQYQVKVFYTHKENNITGWSSPESINDDFDGFCYSFVIDYAYKIHISLDSLQNALYTGKIYYATNKSGSWQLSPVSTSGKTSYGNLAIDGEGIGHIIAENSTNFFEYQSSVVHFQSSNNLVNINTNQSNYIEDFKLLQNYPNPFNPVTTINYSIPNTQYTILKVYDALGKEVITLVNEKQNAGRYEIEFNGSNFSSGIYFYKIEAGDFVATKRMVLLK